MSKKNWEYFDAGTENQMWLDLDVLKMLKIKEHKPCKAIVDNGPRFKEISKRVK